MVFLVAVTCLARRRRMHCRGGDAGDAAETMELDQRRRPSSGSHRHGRRRFPQVGGPAPDSGLHRRRQAAVPAPEEAPAAAVAASEEAPAGGEAGIASAASSEASSSPVLCAVSLEELRRRRRGGEAETTLPCSHSYHPACVLPWLAAHGDCPCCRAAVPSPENCRH